MEEHKESTPPTGSSAPTDSPKPSVGDSRPAPRIGDSRPAPTSEVAAKPERNSQPKQARGGNAPRDRDAEDGSSDAARSAPRKRRRSRGGGPATKPGERSTGRYLMAVHVQGATTHIAMLEGRSLVEHYVARAADETNQIDGNIYVGRVQNVLPGMEAAFVDIGIPKNAVLYRGDVRYESEELEAEGEAPKAEARIEEMLRNGQTIICQVTKNPIGAKGARLTQEVSLPGRFAVLVPNSSTFGISKRLGDNERKRLRKIIDGVKPEKHGLIVRTPPKEPAKRSSAAISPPSLSNGSRSKPMQRAPAKLICSTASPTRPCACCVKS
ncbi:MAG: ribonuclease E/G [Actinomycetes bacterium]